MKQRESFMNIHKIHSFNLSIQFISGAFFYMQKIIENVQFNLSHVNYFFLEKLIFFST